MYDEIELKLRVCDEGDMTADAGLYIARFSAHLSKLHIKHGISSETIEEIETTYYDTRHFALRDAGLVYRIRKSGVGSVATVKIDKDTVIPAADNSLVFNRSEINVELTGRQGDNADIRLFKGTEIWPALKKTAGRKILYEKFKTVILRTDYHVTINGGCSMVISVDKGEIKSGVVTEPIYEIEAELLSGTMAQLLIAGGMLAASVPLMPEPKSKYERGLAAAGSPGTRQTRRKTKARHRDISSVTGYYIHYLQNLSRAQQQFLEGRDMKEHIHEIRVNLRHLQSLMLFCRPFFKHSRRSGMQHPDDTAEQEGMLGMDRYKKLNGIIKEPIRELSPLRESDIFLQDLNEFISTHNMNDIAHDMKGNIEAKRTIELKKIHSVLSRGFLTSLPYILNGWLESCGHELDLFADRDYVYARINRMLDRIIDAMRPEVLIEMGAYHRLRIMIKNVRYMIEDFGDTYFSYNTRSDKDTDNVQMKEAIQYFKKVQDCLGDMHDAYINIGHAARYLPESAFRTDFILWLNEKISLNKSICGNIFPGIFKFVS